MSVNPIIQAQFVDLYLGEGFADVKGLAGAGARRVEVPREWESHAQELLQLCRQTLEELQDPEFAIVVDGVLLRVTLLEDAFSGSVFVLRAASRSEPHGAQADTARLCCARCGPAPTWC